MESDITLALLTPKHITQEYVDWFNDPKVTRHSENQYRCFSIEGQLRYIDEMTESQTDHLYGIFDGNLHIGNVTLSSINFNHRRGEISYVIGLTNYWGHGIASHAVEAICEIARKEFMLHKVVAGCSSMNISSQKVLERNNFQLEGTRKQHLYFDDQWEDQLDYGRILSQ
jgi:[ribosomal protein S5]-alanine N-acetyltransferase